MSHNLRSTCLKVSTLFFFLLFFQFSNAQYDLSGLDAKYQQYHQALGRNVVMLVYKDGKTIYSKEETEFKANTQAPIAAASQWFTAALVMTFVDEGKISLDDKVSKYIPLFSDYSKGFITIRQCLTHMTGIKGDQTMAVILRSNVYPSLEEEVNAFASKHSIQTNAGVEFRYSNIGPNIAGRILEIVSKRNFEQLIQQRLFRPLAMRNSTFQPDYDKPANPANGALSSAGDYINFLSMLLNKGMFKGKRVLSEKAIAEMEQMQVDAPLIKYAPKAGEGLTYGLGQWILEKDASGKSTSVAGPGLYGTWPMIDMCRGYACVVFVKSLLSEQNKAMYMDIKNTIDAQIPCNN